MKRKMVVVAVVVFCVSVVQAGDFPSGVSYATVLNGVKIQPPNGGVRIDNIQATFLPAGVEGSYILRKADGTKLYQIIWRQDVLKQPYVLMSPYKCVNLQTGGECIASDDQNLGGVGDYVLDIYAADKLFYTFPFSVSKLASPNPFAGADTYFLEGDWSRWAYLYYSEANPEQSLAWKVWLRNKGIEREKDVVVRVEIIRDKDKKLICTSREGQTTTLNAQWVRYAFDLIFPPDKTSYGQYFKAKDLLAVDGGYTLTMKIDNALYGTWKFTVAGGKLNYTGRTDRAKANPLTFVEGGLDAFWYSKL